MKNFEALVHEIADLVSFMGIEVSGFNPEAKITRFKLTRRGFEAQVGDHRMVIDEFRGTIFFCVAAPSATYSAMIHNQERARPLFWAILDIATAPA